MKHQAGVLLLLIALAATGCTALRGAGDIITVEIPVEDVRRLAVSHSFEVSVTVGDEPLLTLRVDDNLNESLNVGMEGNTLLIDLEPRTTVSNATLEADLTVPSLDAIEGSGPVEIHSPAPAAPK